MTQKVAKLVFVLDPDNPKAAAKVRGHNKYYNMYEVGDGSFRAEYGRIDETKTVHTYPMSKWNAKYLEKIRGGYKDITPFKQEKDIRFVGAHPDVLALLNKLQTWANVYTKALYYVSAADVTAVQVQAALDALTAAMNATDVDTANKHLLRLYVQIPRRMHNVADYMLTDLKNTDLFDREMKNLQTLANQVALQAGDVTEINPLEQLGLTIVPTTELPVEGGKFVALYKVTNAATQKAFDSILGDYKWLWHGSGRNPAYSILQNGLDVKYARYGNFGRGLYHADNLDKAAAYSGGVYFLQAVKMGRTLTLSPNERRQRYDFDVATRENYDSILGITNYREFVVYQNCRSTVGYLGLT